jgi:hypothetical protein|tara:strand:- start:4188 stop:4457 length:270 start_codon:yes stop_codon:yes gene_type:complete
MFSTSEIAKLARELESDSAFLKSPAITSKVGTERLGKFLQDEDWEEINAIKDPSTWADLISEMKAQGIEHAPARVFRTEKDDLEIFLVL